MYDKPYFYARRISRYDTYQIMMAAIWFALFRPHKVYDLGCGIGSYLHGFHMLGCRISGCDIGYETAKEYMRGHVRRSTYRHDVCKPVRKELLSDLVLCLDVAEHIPVAEHVGIWQNIRRIGKRYALFAGALPRQPGCGHIACQPRDKWIADGEAHGLVMDELATSQAALALKSIDDPLDLIPRLIAFKVPSNG